MKMNMNSWHTRNASWSAGSPFMPVNDLFG